MDGPTDRRTYGRMDTTSYRDAMAHLKICPLGYLYFDLLTFGHFVILNIVVTEFDQLGDFQEIELHDNKITAL